MPILFGVTLFVSATLLFIVQPMIGKMILPLVGGTPGVWNTCMVFFQALLLAGYYYAHKTSSKLPTARQVRIHAGILFLTMGGLALGAALAANHSPIPIVKSLAPQGSDVPFFGVLLLLTLAIGLPFFTISTTAPLLQRWFSETGHPSAKDPYFLYAASNFGSLLALLSYPFLVEPNLRLVQQARLWAIGVVGLAVLIFLCGRVARTGTNRRTTVEEPQQGNVALDPPPHWSTRLRWLLLAAIPSSLMLAVTTSVTTDMVSMPLLWVIPLALYLLTFVIVFAKSTPSWVHLTATLITPVLILLVVFTRIVEPDGTIDFERSGRRVLQHFLDILPFITFFFVALTCHGELARTRPASRHLTGFYLTMSIGGVIGGLFNALFAPVVFTFVSEYPITLVAACAMLPQLGLLLRPNADKYERTWSGNDYFWAIFWDGIVFLLFFAGARFFSAWFVNVVQVCSWLTNKLGAAEAARTVATILAFGLPVLCSYFLVERPLRFGAAVGAILLGTFMTFVIKERETDEDVRAVHARSFFGTMKIELYRPRMPDNRDPPPLFTQLIHGTTVHGMQHFRTGRRIAGRGAACRSAPAGRPTRLAWRGSPSRIIASRAVSR